MMEKKDDLLKLRSKLKENSLSLHMSRVPLKAKKAFLALAEEEFCSDRGMCLKFLMDDLINPDAKMLIAKINELESRIVRLELGSQNEPTKKERVIKMLNGRTVKRK